MISNKKILSVITARKGSKGIKNKNIRELMGKPLFIWSVLASLNSKYIDMTVVSSNCEKVFEEFQKFTKETNYKYNDNNNLRFIQRPDEISGDLSKNEEALIHAIHWIRDIFKKEFSVVLNLQPTSPVRLNKLLDKSIEEYDKGEYNSLLTGLTETPFFWQKINNNWEYIDRYFYIDYVKKIYQSKKQWQLIKFFDDCCNRKMRQEFRGLDDKEGTSDFLFKDNGNIYIIDTKVLISTECRIGNKHCVFPVEKLNSLQIDTEFDFKLIENMAKAHGLKSLI